MLVKPPLEKLLPKTQNRYTLAILVAKRTRQLVDGANPMAEVDSPNLVSLACKEIADEKVVEVHEVVEPVIPRKIELEVERITRVDDDDFDLDYFKKPLLNRNLGMSREENMPPRSKIKILGDNDEMIDPVEYFADKVTSNFAASLAGNTEEGRQILTDLFSEESELLANMGESIDLTLSEED